MISPELQELIERAQRLYVSGLELDAAAAEACKEAEAVTKAASDRWAACRRAEADCLRQLRIEVSPTFVPPTEDVSEDDYDL